MRCDLCNAKLQHRYSTEGGWVGTYECPSCNSLYEITSLGQGYDNTKTMVKRGPYVSIVDDPRYKSLKYPTYRVKMIYKPTIINKIKYFLKKVVKKFGSN